jgi:hypothetical protein
LRSITAFYCKAVKDALIVEASTSRSGDEIKVKFLRQKAKARTRGDDETRKFLGERGRLGRMTRAWMAIVQINGKRMPEVIVQCRRILEDSFLHIARQIRPKLERGMADRMGEA